jgi:hypothetical protein
MGAAEFQPISLFDIAWIMKEESVLGGRGIPIA